MARGLTIGRLAKSSGVEPDDLQLALMERGVEVASEDEYLDKGSIRAAKAVVKELRGAPTIVRPKSIEPTVEIRPAIREATLQGTLTVDDVIFIHDRLTRNFAASEDPIEPPGVREIGLLESAVGRQESGFGGLMKYPSPILNAATLLYGICNDHPFHNGNKRTALVACLAHMDKNNLVLEGTKQSDLLRLMIEVASHRIIKRAVKVGRETELVPRSGKPDEEITAIADWLDGRTRRIMRGELHVTYRELRKILNKFHYSIEHRLRNKACICRVIKPKRILRKDKVEIVMSIEWPGDGRQVNFNDMKRIRKGLGLCEEDGVTKDVFYGDALVVDDFINENRQVLRKLASR